MGEDGLEEADDFEFFMLWPIALVALGAHEGDTDCMSGAGGDPDAGDVASAGFNIAGEVNWLAIEGEVD